MAIALGVQFAGFAADGSLVDGWAVVAAPQVAPSSGFCAMTGASSAAMVRSAVPAGAPQPRIAAIRREGAEVVLTVTGTTPVLDYNVAAGAAPDRLDAAGAARSAVAGDESRPIELRVEAGAGSGFFRVVRDGGEQ